MARAWEQPPEARGASFGMPQLTRVTRALLIANVAAFVVQYVLLNKWFPRTFAFVDQAFALNPLQWVQHFPLVPVWQLLTYGFLHGGPDHLLGNMLGLFFLGTSLEGEIGGRRYLCFYLAAVALAGAFQFAFGLALGQTEPILGASGGVLAIVCAMATLRPSARIIFFIVPMTLRTLALIYVAFDLFGAINQLKGQENHLANFAHLTGALFGYVAVKRNWIWLDPMQRIEAWRERRAVARKVSDTTRLDALLVKIEREGIHTLSAGERAFLKRVSQRK